MSAKKWFSWKALLFLQPISQPACAVGRWFWVFKFSGFRVRYLRFAMSLENLLLSWVTHFELVYIQIYMSSSFFIPKSFYTIVTLLNLILGKIYGIIYLEVTLLLCIMLMCNIFCLIWKEVYYGTPDWWSNLWFGEKNPQRRTFLLRGYGSYAPHRWLHRMLQHVDVYDGLDGCNR